MSLNRSPSYTYISFDLEMSFNNFKSLFPSFFATLKSVMLFLFRVSFLYLKIIFYIWLKPNDEFIHMTLLLQTVFCRLLSFIVLYLFPRFVCLRKGLDLPLEVGMCERGVAVGSRSSRKVSLSHLVSATPVISLKAVRTSLCSACGLPPWD